MLMVLGILIFGCGLYFYVQVNNDTGIVADNAIGASLPAEHTDADTTADKTVIEAEPVQKPATENNPLKNDRHIDNEDINKKQGNDFEKFVVQKFDKKYFTLKEWAGDKFVKGVYAETTTQPDLLFEFRLKNVVQKFAVECKWRSNFYNNGIEFATEAQLARYKEYHKSKNIPVFIAIGVGNTGAKPERLFIMPLAELEANFLPLTLLKKYEKVPIDKNFFFDTELQVLK